MNFLKFNVKNQRKMLKNNINVLLKILKSMYKLFFSFLLILFLALLFFYIENIKIFIFDVFINLQILKEKNFLYFLSLLFLFNFFNMLTPIPTTPVIIFNGFVLGSLGFVLSICTTIICSSILFTVSKKNYPLFFPKIINKYIKKLLLFKKSLSIFLLIFITRYIIPYFFHNLLFGLFYKKLKIFILLSTLAEIPIIYALNNFGKHLNFFTQSYDLSRLLNVDLLLSIVLFLFIAIFFSLLNKKFKF